MKNFACYGPLLFTLFAFGPAVAAAPSKDIEPGKELAQSVCAACHGASGVSISDTIPNLAGQRRTYLESQLRALKSGTRKAPSMNSVASQLSEKEISAVSDYFARLAKADAGETSTMLPALVRTRVVLPADFPNGFTKYQTVNRADLGQVRFIFANAVAVQAAREGRSLPDGSVIVLEQHTAKLDSSKRPIVGADGFYLADRLLAYAVMGRAAGWGEEFPDMLRNADWNYASFTPEKQIRSGFHQADCLACHKPLDQLSYVFSFEPLKAAAHRR
jgi:cytochrome c553